MIALRNSTEYHDTLVYGKFEPYLWDQRNLFAYKRIGERTVLVAGNFQNKPQDMRLPSDVCGIIMNNYDDSGVIHDVLHLKPYQFVVMEL